MKKIGIVTVHHYHNYGSMLQAFATQYAIEKYCGCQAEIIDVCPPGLFYISRKSYNYNHPSDYDFCMSLFKTQDNKKDQIKHFLHRMKTFRDLAWIFRNITRNKEKFGEFSSFRNNYHLSKFRYKTEDLYDHAPEYNGYVVASDQVWNAYITYNNPTYFLTFVKNGAPKMAYASSIGLPKIPSEAETDFIRGMKNFDFISLREKESAELVTKISGCPAKHVLDPTLLLNAREWSMLAAPQSIGNKYVLTYFLQPTKFMYSLAEKAAKDLGIELIHIEPSRNDSGNGIRFTGPVSVEEWLRLFMDAELVITNSFHGMAFSTNFNIPFITTLRWKNSKVDMNSRHRSFIEQFHFEKRFMQEGEYPDKDKYSFDYTTVNHFLEEARKDSISFLSQITQNKP